MTVKPTPSQPRGNSLQNEAFFWRTLHHSIACGPFHGRCLEVMICFAQMFYLPHLIFNVFLRKASPWCRALLGRCSIILGASTACKWVAEGF